MTTSAPRVLVCGWAGAGNIGDELLTRAVCNELLDAGVVPVVASRDPVETRRLHEGAEAIHWGPRGMLAARSVDAVCVGPGGILQDSSSIWNLPGHLVLPWIVRRRGRPMVGVGLGVEPLQRRWSGRVARRVLKEQTIVCRDAESVEALRAVGVDAVTGCDVVFGLDLPSADRRAELVVSVGPSVGPGRFAPASRRLIAEDPAMVATQIDHLAERLGVDVAFVAFRGERDRVASIDLASRLDAASVVVDDDLDVQVERVAAARAVLTSRYHPVVIAAATGTPAVVVSTQLKLASLIAQISDPLVTACPSWDAVSAVSVPQPRSVGLVPDGLDHAVAALRSVAAAATATRGPVEER